MSEKRFFEKSGPYTLKKLSDHISGKLDSLKNSEIIIKGIASLKNAKSNEISFFSNLTYKKDLQESNAGACIINNDYADLAPKGMPLLLCDDPYMGFALISQKFYPQEMNVNYLTKIKNDFSKETLDK